MIDYKLEQRYARNIGYGSLGMTDKFYKDQYWYKKNLRGYEGKSEAVCTMLLKHSSVTNYAQYEECLINGEAGCRSKSFLNAEENVVTFQRLYDLAYGGNLKNKVNSYARLDDRIQYVIDFIGEYTGLNITDYLRKVLYFDMLTLDVDRHFFNLAVIQTKDGWLEAPLFDFGASFFSMQHIFKPEMTLEQKLSIITPQPFASSFDEQANYFGESGISFDYRAIEAELIHQPDWIADVVKYQLEQCREFFPDKNESLQRLSDNIMDLISMELDAQEVCDSQIDLEL